MHAGYGPVNIAFSPYQLEIMANANCNVTHGEMLNLNNQSALCLDLSQFHLLLIIIVPTGDGPVSMLSLHTDSKQMNNAIWGTFTTDLYLGCLIREHN